MNMNDLKETMERVGVRVELYGKFSGGGNTGGVAHVASVYLPPFQLWPESILWGSRTFYPRRLGDALRTPEPPDYFEGLMWPAL